MCFGRVGPIFLQLLASRGVRSTSRRCAGRLLCQIVSLSVFWSNFPKHCPKMMTKVGLVTPKSITNVSMVHCTLLKPFALHCSTNPCTLRALEQQLFCRLHKNLIFYEKKFVSLTKKTHVTHCVVRFFPNLHGILSKHNPYAPENMFSGVGNTFKYSEKTKLVMFLRLCLT